MRFYERSLRSLIKAVTFRVIVVTSDFIIVFALTKRYDLAFGMVILTNVASTILFYLHERLWNTVSWGRKNER
jgi:uncharacterized membrane protein